jgi:hypothetical protein
MGSVMIDDPPDDARDVPFVRAALALGALAAAFSVQWRSLSLTMTMGVLSSFILMFSCASLILPRSQRRARRGRKKRLGPRISRRIPRARQQRNNVTAPQEKVNIR